MAKPAKKYKMPLFREVGPLTYHTWLNKAKHRWLAECCPGAQVQRVPYPNYKFMPSYKFGLWDGMVDEIKFVEKGHAMLFKLAWMVPKS